MIKKGVVDKVRFNTKSGYFVNLKGRRYNTDWYGFLSNFDDFDSNWQWETLQIEGIIKDMYVHIEVICKLRALYLKHEKMPNINSVAIEISMERICEAFPGGIGQACLIAGIPRPVECRQAGF